MQLVRPGPAASSRKSEFGWLADFAYPLPHLLA